MFWVREVVPGWALENGKSNLTSIIAPLDRLNGLLI
jgi:hypothetical protein